MYEQQKQAGEKSGLVRAASSKLAHLLSGDIDTLLSDLSNGSIGGIKLDDATVQTIISSATSSALETAIRSNAAMREIELRHKLRIEVEQARHANRLQQRQDRGCMTDTETDPDSLSIAELMAREGTQEEAISASGAIQSSLSRPPSPDRDQIFGDYYDGLSAKHKRAVLSEWFEGDEQSVIGAEQMSARYVFDSFTKE